MFPGNTLHWGVVKIYCKRHAEQIFLLDSLFNIIYDQSEVGEGKVPTSILKDEMKFHNLQRY